MKYAEAKLLCNPEDITVNTTINRNCSYVEGFNINIYNISKGMLVTV